MIQPAPLAFTLLGALLTACGGGADADGGLMMDASVVLDGGPSDAGALEDAARADGATDAGTADAGASDAGGPDSGVDGGPVDEPDWPDTDLPPPEWVDLTVGPEGSCPPLTACGGPIVGVWDLDGGCFEVDIESAIESCPGAMVTRREGRGRGRVVFGETGAAHRVAESVVESDIFFPAVCAAFFSCTMLEAAMRSVVTEASCAADSAGNCECTATLVTRIDDRDTYTTEANEIVGGFSGKRWSYCVDGPSLRYEDTSTSGALEPGTVSLRER